MTTGLVTTGPVTTGPITTGVVTTGSMTTDPITTGADTTATITTDISTDPITTSQATTNQGPSTTGIPVDSETSPPTSTADAFSNSSPSKDDSSVVVVVLSTLLGIVVVPALVGVLVFVLWRIRRETETADVEMKQKESIPKKGDILSDITIQQQIGSGHSGEVYAGLWMNTKVALKRVNAEELSFFKELSILQYELHNFFKYFTRKLQHPHVVQV